MYLSRAVVVAQLVERSLPTPEFQGLNPVIGKIVSTNIKRQKIKKKRPGMAHLKKIIYLCNYLKGIQSSLLAS